MRSFFSKDRWWTSLIIGLLLLSLWLVMAVFERVTQNEQEQNLATTSADLYWFDQTVNNRLNRDQLRIWTLAREIAAGSLSSTNFNARTQQLLVDAPEITAVTWLDKEGQTKARMVTMQAQTPADITERVAAEDKSIKLATDIRETSSTPPIKMLKEGFEIITTQPFYNDNNEIEGYVESQYNLKQLFVASVPDWFAKKHHLHIYFGDDRIYTSEQGAAKFDTRLPISTRNIYLSTTAFEAKAQMYPDDQVWILRGLFTGMVVLLLALLGSLVALVRDMRGRRVTENELRAQYNLRHAIEKSLTVGIRAQTMDGTMIYVNPAFCEMIGYAESEVLNVAPPFLPYVPTSEAGKTLWASSTVLDDPEAITVTELKMRRKSGEIIDTIMRGGPLYDENQKQIGWISSVEDVTERRRLEMFQADEQKRLESVNHLISMGEMASVIAHELNQPLSAILGYTTGISNYIKRDASALSGERLIEVAEKIRRQAERAANVSRRVQQFVQQKTIAPAETDVAYLVNQTIDFMEFEFKKKMGKVVNHVKEGEVRGVMVDVTMMQQILINLLRNALEAMLEAGSEPREVHVYAQNYSNHHVLVRVIDNGPGIPPDKVETIFKPFYTTKTHGVGIGLNICRTMMESNGGRLWAKANPAGGEFYLTLPTDSKSADDC